MKINKIEHVRPDLNNTNTWKTIGTNEITCDICSESCENIEATKAWDLEGSEKEYDYVELRASWGYFSDWDGETWEAHVCTECVKQHLFPLVKFNVRNYMYDSMEIGTRVNGVMEYIEREDFILPPTGPKLESDPYEL
jgi:hypothetical protein